MHEGYLRALREPGRRPSDELVAEVPTFTVDAGRAGAARLMELPAFPTAIVAGSAVHAVGVLNEAKARGLDVPGDVAIVGYTDPELAALVDPPLTMVSVPARAAGARAMRTLHRLMAGERVRPRRAVLGADLVLRESCGSH